MDKTKKSFWVDISELTWDTLLNQITHRLHLFFSMILLYVISSRLPLSWDITIVQLLNLWMCGLVQFRREKAEVQSGFKFNPEIQLYVQLSCHYPPYLTPVSIFELVQNLNARTDEKWGYFKLLMHLLCRGWYSLHVGSWKGFKLICFNWILVWLDKELKIDT